MKNTVTEILRFYYDIFTKMNCSKVVCLFYSRDLTALNIVKTVKFKFKLIVCLLEILFCHIEVL